MNFFVNYFYLHFIWHANNETFFLNKVIYFYKRQALELWVELDCSFKEYVSTDNETVLLR